MRFGKNNNRQLYSKKPLPREHKTVVRFSSRLPLGTGETYYNWSGATWNTEIILKLGLWACTLLFCSFHCVLGLAQSGFHQQWPFLVFFLLWPVVFFTTILCRNRILFWYLTVSKDFCGGHKFFQRVRLISIFYIWVRCSVYTTKYVKLKVFSFSWTP